MVSFVVIYHPRRLDNLNQMLRFMSRRESSLLQNSELVLVCQNHCTEEFESGFSEVKHINLECDTYCKPKMTNAGVAVSQGDVLVLLDSDRILPYGYYTRLIPQMKEKQVITTQNLYTFDQPYEDDEIESGKVRKKPDFRSLTNQGRYKNMFSGNTIMWRSDYDAIGGYDENYVGYGFSDTDMTRNALLNDLKMVFKQEDEYHLFHDQIYDWESGHIHKDEYRIISAINSVYYCNKWKIEADKGVNELWEEVSSLINRYHRVHVDKFNRLLGDYYIAHTGSLPNESKRRMV